MLKRYHGGRDYIIKRDSIVLDKDLQYEEEPIPILYRDVQKPRTKEIKSMKVNGSIIQLRKLRMSNGKIDIYCNNLFPSL